MEETKTSKKENAIQQAAQYKERFQFILYSNEDIVCQRYFKCGGFSYKSLQSYELYEAFMTAVNLIKEDFASKSRIYLWYTASLPLKMEGYENNAETTYLDYPEGTFINYFDDTERPEPNEVVFRFVLMVDDNVVYETAWDASDYPKYVRSNIDLTNSSDYNKNRDLLLTSFVRSLSIALSKGKQDLVNVIVRLLCDTMANGREEKQREYITTMDFGGDKELSMSLWDINKQAENDWYAATKQKTYQYNNSLYTTDTQTSRKNKRS